MTPEEFKRIKEAEKEHLRSLRKLKAAVRDLERQKRLTDAVRKATEDPMAALDANESLVDDLAMETAQNEARLEVALENVGAEDPEAAALEIARSEEVLRKLRAKELVQQVRQQIGGAPASSGATEDSANAPEGHAEPASDQSDTPKTLPDKTIGRMKP